MLAIGCHMALAGTRLVSMPDTYLRRRIAMLSWTKSSDVDRSWAGFLKKGLAGKMEPWRL